MNNYDYVKKSRDKRKDDIVYVMGDKCQICGYNKCIAALELHHIDPNEKDFSFNKKDNLSWEKIIQELPKCILLCANCHREVHQNLIFNELKTSFDKQKADTISKKIADLKAHKIYYCKYCGKIVSSGNNCCVECASINRRIVERPSREELKNLIREKTFLEIGKMFNVSDNAIRKWCDKYNLPRKKSEIKSYTNEEWEKI